MLGITPDGAAVEVDRGDRPTPHSLSHATVAEIRSTFTHALRDAGRSWADIAVAMRCTRQTARAAAEAPPLRLHFDDRAGRSPLAGATIPEIRAVLVTCLRAAGLPSRVIARVMRCSTVTVKRDANPRVLQPLHREVLAHAG